MVVVNLYYVIKLSFVRVSVATGVTMGTANKNI